MIEETTPGKKLFDFKDFLVDFKSNLTYVRINLQCFILEERLHTLS